jgi:hypothetical protein
MTARARWLLLTHEGRVVLAIAYWAAGLASIVTYSVMRSPLYGLGQLVIIAFGYFWTQWCLSRR